MKFCLSTLSTSSNSKLACTLAVATKKKQCKSVPGWSDEGAPFQAHPFTTSQIVWFPILAVIAKGSIDALNNDNATVSFLWIIYESYIVFDHVPFLFTNELYDSPRFNFTYLSLIFFWGLEAVASIVATQSNVGAPKLLLYNVAPHSFFIFANSILEKATSNAFSGSAQKKGWIFLQVGVDNAIHGICLWYHLVHLSSIAGMGACLLVPLLSWVSLVSLMILLTCWVHKRHMSWSHFFRSLSSLKK